MKDQMSAPTLPPLKSFDTALHDFMCMARRQSQSRIITYFLEQVIECSDMCDNGTVHVYFTSATHPIEHRLKLHQGKVARNLNSVAAFDSDDFSVDEGLAGLAFRKRCPEFARQASVHPEFKKLDIQKDSDIGSIYCVPVFLDEDQPPFGVVSFHNTVQTNRDLSDEQKRSRMDLSVKILEAMLSLAHIPLVYQEKLFVVHGRDTGLVDQLKFILREQGVDPVMVQTYARTGQDLLTFIEHRIRGCVGGFVLLTPDDEGRLYRFGEPLRQRARQNVIFEGGYLTALFRRTHRICFLQQGELEIPSDLNGLLMEQFQDSIDRDRIILTLKEWNLGKCEDRGLAPDVPPEKDGRPKVE